MGKRTKTKLAALMLVVWQAGVGLTFAASVTHAHHAGAAAESVPAPVASDDAMPCHGHEAAPVAETPAAPGTPPCCLSDRCQGDCLLIPALPAAPVTIAVTRERIDHPREPLQARVPPRLVEFFRPPI